MSTADDAPMDEWLVGYGEYRAQMPREPLAPEAFAAGYRRALEDAQEHADEIEGAPLYIDADNTVIWIHTRPQIDKWLRDRAAGVGTKDGADDE